MKAELSEARERSFRPTVHSVIREMWEPTYRIATTHRRAATTIIYSAIAVAAYFGAFLIRFDFQIPAEYVRVFVATVPVLLLLRLASSYILRISTSRWRFVSTQDVVRLVAAAVAGSLALFALTWGAVLFPLVPRSILLIDCMLYTYLIAAVWLVYRTGFERSRKFLHGSALPGARVLIVGAGDSGSSLAREMVRMRIPLQPVGFVDDDPAKWHSTVHGLKIFGGTALIPAIVREHNVHEILIAIPSAKPRELRRIVEQCSATDVSFKVLPGLATVVNDRSIQWSQVRSLRIEDLLGREPITLELPELYEDLRGQSVLITGAAGSIGSELARQVALHKPEQLVLFDQSETALFHLVNELVANYPGQNLEFIVGDVTDTIAVEQVFRRFRPGRVFHAAAYKHVPMMQTNLREAIRNNVHGTLLTAVAAAQHGAEKFVFVSSDKAVRPTSVMGVSKRLGEMLILELQAQYPATSYSAVRFGNVLGSNGSVLPIFRQQIEEGKPLTVTHPDATRYFMMIPEAVQLILQASLLPEAHGHIVMLEMGEPVRIMDLARTLLQIAGRPQRLGETLVITGLRPGEKLHEQLIAPGENTTPTRVAKVNLVTPDRTRNPSVIRLLAKWEEALRHGLEEDVIRDMCHLFPSIHESIPETNAPMLTAAV